MRIIAGRNKGKKITTLSGDQTRPTSDRVREAIFNILRHQVVGTCVLDLFAGSGALGLEALSRGAREATFVDCHPRALSVIRRNIQACQRESQTNLIQWNIEKGLSCLTSHHRKYQLIFLDPPYHSRLISPTLMHLNTTTAMVNEAVVVAEHDRYEPIVTDLETFRLTDQRRYGKTHLSIWEYRTDDDFL
jgi:16S rRNA (guanine966-N2)-methyltransferase